MAGVGFSSNGERGRPSQSLPAEAQALWEGEYSSSDVRPAGTAYSLSKGIYRCSHGSSKHKTIKAADTVSRDVRAVLCRVCTGKGSKYEQEAYALLDQMPCITKCAAEVHALQGATEFEGWEVNLGNHSWDILLLQPAKVLIAVQGEQHDGAPDTREHSSSAGLDDSAALAGRDRALAEGAVQQGFQVVWLVPGDSKGRSRRWRNAIELAIQHAAAGKQGMLHMA
jgi:hypothetical protein